MANQTQPASIYSTHQISDSLLSEIAQSLKHVSPFGSVEIYVQDSTVTQITVRNIKKTTTHAHKTQTGVQKAVSQQSAQYRIS